VNRIARAWSRCEPLVGTRRAALALAAVSLGVYALTALAWPVQRGRDTWDYLVYYLSLLDGSTPFPLVMLVRTPVTPLVLGPAAQVGGATGLEVLGGLLFAVMIVAWAAVACTFSRLAAVIVAGVLLLTVPFAQPFHEPSSDMVVAVGFALFALGVVRAWRRPAAWRFAALGGGVAVLTLTRPPYQVLLLAIVLPLVLGRGWRAKAGWAGAFLAAALLPLAAWAAHNSVRYGDTTVSRARVLNVPFVRAFGAGVIEPGNGPASRRLAELVRTEVLPLEPYHGLGVDVSTYLRSGENFEAVRLAGLVDRVDGLDSDYALLAAAAREARRGGELRIRGVNVKRSLLALRYWLTEYPTREHRTKPSVWLEPAPTIDVGGAPFPNPAAQPPSPDAVPYGFLQCASDEIDRCILREPGPVIADPALARRYTEVTATMRRFDEGLGARSPNPWLAARLDSARRVLPPLWLWLAVALGALVIRRPAGALPIAGVLLLAGAVLAVHALGVGRTPLFALPVLPAICVTAIVALLAPRSRSAATR